MWIVTTLGFFSVVCARMTDGSGLDPDTVMIRSRRAEHIGNLRSEFPVLQGFPVLTNVGTDYAFRLIVPHAVWVSVMTELAERVDYGNFKSEAARDPADGGYLSFLHAVWARGRATQSKDS